MNYRRRSRRGNPADNQISAIRQLELGGSLSSRLIFRSEISRLTQLNTSHRRLHPSTFSSGRHAYISELVSSPDKALLAVASTDGRIEVHEPADTETLRLAILPTQNKKLSSVAWGSLRSSDCLLLGFDQGVIALYDLNTCQVDRPTRQFFHNSQSLADVTTLDGNTFATAVSNGMNVYDARVKKSIATVETQSWDAVLTGEDIFIYAANNGEVVLWDRRKLTSQSRVGTMAKRRDTALTRLTFSTGRFNDIRLVPDAAPGSLFFYHSDGTVGHVDIVSRNVESSPEQGLRIRNFDPSPNDTGLEPYGTSEHALDYPWYVHRRRMDVMSAPRGPGWRAIVPNVKTKGFRFVGFASDMSLQTYSGSLPASQHYSCAHAIDGQLDRIVLGDVKNKVHVYEVHDGCTT